MGRDPEALPRFYAFLDAGKLPSTSQINQFAYYDYFKELLEQGGDVLHIAFGSGMTQSVNQAYEAAEQLRAEFPGQRLEVIDSCAVPPAMACWSTARPICATRTSPWTKRSTG